MAKATQHQTPREYAYKVRAFMTAIIPTMIAQCLDATSIDSIADINLTEGALYAMSNNKPLICYQDFDTAYGSQSLQAQVYAMRRTMLDTHESALMNFASYTMDLPYWVTAQHIRLFLEFFVLKSFSDKEKRTSRLECTWKGDPAGCIKINRNRNSIGAKPIVIATTKTQLNPTVDLDSVLDPFEPTISTAPISTAPMKSKLNISERGQLYSKLLMEYRNSGLSVEEAHIRATEESNNA